MPKDEFLDLFGTNIKVEKVEMESEKEFLPSPTETPGVEKVAEKTTPPPSTTEKSLEKLVDNAIKEMRGEVVAKPAEEKRTYTEETNLEMGTPMAVLSEMKYTGAKSKSISAWLDKYDFVKNWAIRLGTVPEDVSTRVVPILLGGVISLLIRFTFGPLLRKIIQGVTGIGLVLAGLRKTEQPPRWQIEMFTMGLTMLNPALYVDPPEGMLSLSANISSLAEKIRAKDWKGVLSELFNIEGWKRFINKLKEAFGAKKLAPRAAITPPVKTSPTKVEFKIESLPAPEEEKKEEEKKEEVPFPEVKPEEEEEELTPFIY